MHCTRRSGFTLIELSIVLIIIGLIVSGLLVGRDLIKGSERQKTVAQFNEIVTAVNTFKLKYNALPGDMPNATTFWGRHAAFSATDSCSNWSVANWDAWELAAIGQATCNGDGNKRFGSNSTKGENIVFWQHLSNAGLLSTQYKGGKATGSGSIVPIGGVHLPKAKLSYRSYNISDTGSLAFAINPALGHWEFAPYAGADILAMLDGDGFGHNLVLGNPRTNGWVYNGILPADAFWIDEKMDDAMPATGKMIANDSGCTTGAGAARLYNKTSATNGCTLMWINAF